MKKCLATITKLLGIAILMTLFVGSMAYAQSTPPPPPTIDENDIRLLEERQREQAARQAQEGQRQRVDVDCDAASLNSGNCRIYYWVAIFVRALSAMVGIIVVIMVAVGGIEYAASKDNPQATAAAKNRIKNAILALIMYIFMFAFLQWIVPGGVV
jgi:hypothetical protein